MSIKRQNLGIKMLMLRKKKQVIIIASKSGFRWNPLLIL